MRIWKWGNSLAVRLPAADVGGSTSEKATISRFGSSINGCLKSVKMKTGGVLWPSCASYVVLCLPDSSCTPKSPMPGRPR